MVEAMNVSVIGAGIMGNGIAQAAAMAGHRVTLTDVTDEALERGLRAIDRSLARFVKAQRLTEEDAASARERVVAELDVATAVREAQVVVEAVSEKVELKWQVFEAVVAAAPAGALLGSNTSQISITVIGSRLGDAAPRLIGTHFFNPPVMMGLCELIRGLETSDETLERARAFAHGLGKEVVVCAKDSPGFITSRAAAALRLECLRMLEEGVATAEDIDTAMRLGFNHPMGPLELGDFNGLDTYLHALTSLAEAHGERFRPTVGLKSMVAAGRLGRKTGRGFYSYREDGTRIEDGAGA